MSASHPVRGAWIEILDVLEIRVNGFVSHPVRGAWIEIMNCLILLNGKMRRIP